MRREEGFLCQINNSWQAFNKYFTGNFHYYQYMSFNKNDGTCRHKVTIYGKKECCLCDQAMDLLEKVNALVPFELDKIDISDNPELLAEFGLKIPVILVDGIQEFKYRINENRLRALLS